MTLASDIESETASARLFSQADGVVVLAYGGASGGCGVQLIDLLEELSESLPVLIIQPEETSEGGAATFEGKVSKVESVPPDPGQAQNAAVMSAMRSLAIKAPILILLNPLFIPFWERAFGVYRMFAVTERFRNETEKREEAEGREAFEREKRKRILLFERSVDSVLFEEDGDFEWMRQAFVYQGVSHRIESFTKSEHASMLARSEEAISKQSRYPHRLDILILIDDLGRGQELASDGAVSIYYRCSRHHVYFALKRSNEEMKVGESIPDYSGFDVLLIDQSSDSKASEAPEKRVIDAVNGFRGLKGVVIKSGSDVASEKIVADWGIQFLVFEDTVGRQGERVANLDAFISSLMPGLPSWQLHCAGTSLSHQAWTYEELLTKYADEGLEIEGQIDPIEELGLLDEEKVRFESELDCMRREISDQDQMILELVKKKEELKRLEVTRREKTEGLGFIKKAALKIRGKL
ncbi:MAG: hypothetical protein QM496_01030 [Verrucomicrobiota bacterium]